MFKERNRLIVKLANGILFLMIFPKIEKTVDCVVDMDLKYLGQLATAPPPPHVHNALPFHDLKDLQDAFGELSVHTANPLWELLLGPIGIALRGK